jgi:hypothetical protein
MTDELSIKENEDSLRIIEKKLKETAELSKKSLEKLNNYSLSDFTNTRDPLSKIFPIIDEQKKVIQNIHSTVNFLSEKIRTIQNSVIGDPNNLSQVGTILERLEQLERRIVPDPAQWPYSHILNANPITTQEENQANVLLTLLYEMVEYAKVNAGYKQIKFPLNSNIGESHLRFERRFYNIRKLCQDGIGVVDKEFIQAVLSIANYLHDGLILTSCLDIGAPDNIKLIKHRKSFDELGIFYAKTIEHIFENCPFEIKDGVKESFLSLPFPKYYKDDENE